MLDLDNITVMKKSILTIAFLASALMLMSQQAQTPTVFRNHLELVSYQWEHPDQIPLRYTDGMKAFASYAVKLDSVVGSDDFDWTRWKNVYTYTPVVDDNGQEHYSDLNRTELSYVWEDPTWKPEVKTEFFDEDTLTRTMISRWDAEDWMYNSNIIYHYRDFDGERLLTLVETKSFVDMAWVDSRKSVYEYDSVNNLVLNVNYVYSAEDTLWRPSSKYEYAYDEAGAMTNRNYFTMRSNGNWRESSRDTLSYDENHRCLQLLTRTRGGYGPGANVWRDSQKVEFSYTDEGSLESETTYVASWFSTEMSLDNKSEYDFDANGNLSLKSANIYNGQDWVVRDTYENTYDMSVDASTILGLAPMWESTLQQGMNSRLAAPMPLNHQWKSCSIISMALDTQFNLYYSGFASVGENPISELRVYGTAGHLVVENAAPADVVVYDVLGRVVASKSQTVRDEFELKPGLYFVNCGASVVKAVVR